MIFCTLQLRISPTNGTQGRPGGASDGTSRTPNSVPARLPRAQTSGPGTVCMLFL